MFQTCNKSTHAQDNNDSFEQITPQFIKPVNVSKLLQKPQFKISKTKKICTLGPKTSTLHQLIKLIDNGMNVARLNFSHGTHQTHAKFIQVIKEANKLRPDRKLAILLDTKGPEIRTGKNLDATDYTFLSTSSKISCSYADIVTSVSLGSQVLFSDGKISSIVKKIDLLGKIVTVQVLNNGRLGEKKNMCLPGCVVNLPTINPYDQNDIIDFGLKYKVDFIAVSFARYSKDIEYIREILAEKDKQYSKQVGIISKIQNHQALQNLDEIIAASDGIMVARGDLGMETSLQKITLLQKLIVTKTINAGKFVIVATQMLESMETKPRPTRAEVSDITNAILDLADCIMTSGQTANGQFPEQTVSYMNNISLQTQKICNYRKLFEYRAKNVRGNINAEALKLVEHSFQKQADIIFLRTQDIELVKAISACRPSAYIFVFSKKSQELGRLACLNYGASFFNSQFYHNPRKLLSSIQSVYGLPSEVNILTAQLNGSLFSCHFHQINLN